MQAHIIFFFLKEHKSITGKNNNNNNEQYILNKPKNNVAFTHSPNKCYNIFTKHLFSIVVGHSFIFFILFQSIRN